jgi:DsbC/DsbD-like thiol-disulfide interchange protein
MAPGGSRQGSRGAWGAAGSSIKAFMSAAARSFCRLCRLVVLAALIGAPGGALVFSAAGATPWHEAGHSRIRLISARELPYRGRLQSFAGIDIGLEAGWRTYWRTPGDGLAPTFDWKGSQNLKSASLLWPAPKHIPEPGGLMAAGYEGRVILPVLLEAEDPGKPIELTLKIAYGVCREICIPEEAVLHLDMSKPVKPAFRDAIAAALDRVPKLQDRGVHCPHSFLAARKWAAGGKPALIVKTAFEEQATGLDLFVEAPDGTALPVPAKLPDSPRGRAHYIIGLEDEAAANALLDKTLTLTLVSDQGSCETTWRVK